MFKKELATKYKIPYPSNISLLKAYHKLLKEKRTRRSEILERLLRKRPIRSLSGISNVSVLTKPYSCPGKCIFCPTETGFPKSYVSGEPAAERARNLKFHPYVQTKRRIEMLESQGHPTDKIELRIIGGTFSFYPKKYQNWFVKECFRGCNESSKSKIQTLKLKSKDKTLKEVQRANEKAKHRIVGLSIETRVDFITEKEILRLRDLGVTMVELGVQNALDELLLKSQTGFSSKDIVRATCLLKDAGFKVLYQTMPNLPGADLKKDLESFKLIFNDERFKPDWLKIYPCIVHRKSLLYKQFKRGNYQSYTNRELIGLLIKIKQRIPYWVRLARLFRDIPASQIEAGSKTSNLREVIEREMKKGGLRCRCIRCREIKEKYNPKEKVCLFREEYKASGGKEIFLSWENKERTKLFSFLRLRIPSFCFSGKKHFLRVLDSSAIIRELHTYGQQIPVSEKGFSPQHRGLGKKLIEEAEKITKKEFGLRKIAVISGIGARKYYRKLGYRLKDTYMAKMT